jgi:hypothetical protein
MTDAFSWVGVETRAMRHTYSRSSFIAAIALASVVVIASMGLNAATAQASGDTTAPVLFVHGIEIANPVTGAVGTSCADNWGPLEQAFRTTFGGWTGDLKTVGYYQDDSSDCDISLPTDADNNTPIEEIATDLAWEIYDTYGTNPVNLVGFSMGGLIIRRMLVDELAGNPTYPPALNIPNLVTVQSPLGGATLANLCGVFLAYVQCQEMSPGSDFLNWFATHDGTGGTNVTEIGSSSDNVVSGNSATTFFAQHKIIYGADANYGHLVNPSMKDTSPALDLTASVLDQPAPSWTTANNVAHGAQRIYQALLDGGGPPPTATTQTGTTLSGPTTGGTAVTLTATSGANLTGASVSLVGPTTSTNPGSYNAPVTYNNGSTLTFVTPDPPFGTYNIVVKTANGSSVAGQFTFVAAPVVNAVVPNSTKFPFEQTKDVQIYGSNFSGATTGGVTAVDFGGKPALSYTLQLDGHITATAPPVGNYNVVHVRVTTANGGQSNGGCHTPTQCDQFTYDSPPPAVLTGSASGYPGQLITLHGMNLRDPKPCVWWGDPTVGHFPHAYSDCDSPAYVATDGTYLTVRVPPRPSGCPVAPTCTSVVYVLYNGPFQPPPVKIPFTWNAIPTGSVGVDPTYGPESGLSSPTNGVPITIMLTGGSKVKNTTAVWFGTAPGLLNGKPFTLCGTCTTWYLLVGLPPGTGQVPLTIKSGRSTYRIDTFTYVPPPHITSITPAIANPGDTVTITGTNLANVESITFGGVYAPSFTDVASQNGATYNGEETITAVVPGPVPGTKTAAVRVKTDGTIYAWEQVSGPNPPADIFTYDPPAVVNHVDPSQGTTNGGAEVNLTGINFFGATAVLFGGVPAPSFTVNSDNSITATAPAHGPGQVDVTVNTPGFVGAANANDAFTYLVPPTITSLTPAKGTDLGGTKVTIQGTGFSTVNTVLFTSASGTNRVGSASFTIVSDTQIVAQSRPNDPGWSLVSVAGTHGANPGTFSALFYYGAHPSVVAITPTSGPETGSPGPDKGVYIVGHGLTATTKVLFGNVPAAEFTVDADWLIYALVPALPLDASFAPVHITVINPYGTSAFNKSVTFTYIPAPTITTIRTNDGSDYIFTGGGTPFEVDGTNFTPNTVITLENYPFSATASCVFVDSTELNCTAPPGSGSVGVVAHDVGGYSRDPGTLEYLPQPGLLALTPTSGSQDLANFTLKLYGGNFTDESIVYVNGEPDYNCTFVPGIEIDCLPFDWPYGILSITVANPNGPQSNALQFRSLGVHIDSVSPATGTTAGGTVVHISGGGFTSATGVTFAGAPASFTIVSDTQIDATSPRQSAGSANIVVTSAYNSSYALYRYCQAPATTC